MISQDDTDLTHQPHLSPTQRPGRPFTRGTRPLSPESGKGGGTGLNVFLLRDLEFEDILRTVGGVRGGEPDGNRQIAFDMVVATFRTRHSDPSLGTTWCVTGTVEPFQRGGETRNRRGRHFLLTTTNGRSPDHSEFPLVVRVSFDLYVLVTPCHPDRWTRPVNGSPGETEVHK